MTTSDITPSISLEPHPDSPIESSGEIRIFGARTHNLKSISLDIPLDRMTVITGVSGSGKSSLAFDTILAEGRFRYLSSISSRSRELLQQIDRPDVDAIEALPPVLCIEQTVKGAWKRSTVATASDIHDYLRLLFARVGQLHCPTCHQPVTSQSRSEIVEQALRLQDRQKVIVLAPIIRSQKGSHADVFARIVKDGYVRARVDGEMIDVSSPPEISKSNPHDIDIVVDRLVIKEGIQSRLEESVDLALQLGQGQCVLSHDVDGNWQDRLYSSRLSCPNCGISYPAIEPRVFSFNSPVGACPDCRGWGTITESDESSSTCKTCLGTRLGTIARSMIIEGVSITDLCAMTPPVAGRTVDQWSNHFLKQLDGNPSASSSTNQELNVTIRHLLPEVATRLQFLSKMGLDYLTLDRGCETLSTGELQRTRLAACLGSQLTGVCYILDEPTTGLHGRDTGRLLQSLVRLRDEGNTILLIEHDLEVIRAADHVIDLGPGAGTFGGQVIASGAPSELASNPESVTGRFLSATRPSWPDAEKLSRPERFLRLTGATLHNLKNVTIEIPLQRIVCVTGVSGSGKTSLIMQTLVPAVRQALGEKVAPAGPFQELSGIESFSRVIRIDQSPLGRSARSNPATYSGLWDGVRQVFAKTKESRIRGYTTRNFSLGVREACCPKCAGRGELYVDEKRFSDWSIRCPECDGRRFSPATLSVRYRGRSIADVLQMSITEAAQFFENFHRLAKVLTVFKDLGLGYLTLGQSAKSLSGGEAQRIKLGTELAKSSGAQVSTLFVLDEPTSGLHPADVQQLVYVLRQLVNEGHTVLVVEHNAELIRSSDWIIEVGPGSGPDGGMITSKGILPALNHQI